MRNLYFNEEKALTQDPSKPCSISSSPSDIQNPPADTPYSEKQNDIIDTLYQLSPRCQLALRGISTSLNVFNLYLYKFWLVSVYDIDWLI